VTATARAMVTATAHAMVTAVAACGTATPSVPARRAAGRGTCSKNTG
jgi:hypothetical protein